jgi:hypothetical protein
MKLLAMTLLVAFAVTPALAQSVTEESSMSSGSAAAAADSATVVVPPAQNPNVDDRTAAADTARQDLYKHKLDAANAQAKADSALADRDAAQAQADQDRANKNSAEGKFPQ